MLHPIYASWANSVEARFEPLRQLTITNSNYLNHTVQTRALHTYLRWRSANARHLGVLPLALRAFVVSTLSSEDRRALRERLAPEERAHFAAEMADAEGGRLLMARAGLRLLLGQMLDADPGAVVLADGPCPHCGRPHDLTASSPADRRLHFAAVGRGDLIVYAICRFPVGLGLGVPDGPGRKAWLRARGPARLAAQGQSVARGRCSPPRDSSVEYILRFVDTAPEYDCVVSVALEVPFRPDDPVFRDPSTG